MKNKSSIYHRTGNYAKPFVFSKWVVHQAILPILSKLLLFLGKRFYCIKNKMFFCFIDWLIRFRGGSGLPAPLFQKN